MNYLTHDGKPLPLTSEGIAALEAIRIFLNENIKHNYSRKALAKEISKGKHSITETFIKLYFKDYFGLPLHQYIKKIRMEKTKELLLHKDNYQLKYIAKQVGYKRHTSLSATFHKYYEVTPHDFRKNGKPK